MKNFDWRKYLIECMESTTFLALSTSGKDGLWICPLYFSYDNNFNLYFMSQPKSKHIQNIITNPNVCVAIYSTKYKPEDDVIGIQLIGKALILSDNEVETAYKIHYTRRFPDKGKSEEKTSEYFKGKKAEWKFVKVIPKEICYFDTRFFDEERQTVPKNVLKSGFGKFKDIGSFKKEDKFKGQLEK